MNEFEKINNNSENEINEKTQKIVGALDDLGLNALPYLKSSIFNEGAVSIFMQTPDLHRVIIEKAGPDFTPKEGHFFQGLNVSVHPGSSINADFQQIDYNFNEKGDGQFRKRIVEERKPGMEDVATVHTHDDFAIAALRTLVNANNTFDNHQLEEDMGVNNQPVTIDELNEIEALLQGSVLLDPNDNFRPVA